MWDSEDQRYDDFLPEDSIINRLRHKNIVSLLREYKVTLYSRPLYSFSIVNYITLLMTLIKCIDGHRA